MTTAASCPGDRLFDFFVVGDDDPDPDPPPEPGFEFAPPPSPELDVEAEAVADAGVPELDELLACVVVGTTEFTVAWHPVASLPGELVDDVIPASLPVRDCVVVPENVEAPGTVPAVVIVMITEAPSCVLVIVSMPPVDSGSVEDCVADVGGTCPIDGVVASVVAGVGAVTMLYNSLATLLIGFSGAKKPRSWIGIACAAHRVK